MIILNNLIIYFKTLKNANYIDIIKEIVSTFLGIISYFFYLYYYSLVLKFLTPVHYIFSNAIYYFFNQLIFLFYHKYNTRNYFSGPEGHYTFLKFHQFQLNIVSDSFALFGFLVYLEFIELKFCKLNYNLKKHIRKRSIEDSIQNGFLIDEQNENQQNNLDDEKEQLNISLSSEMEKYTTIN